jgi:hypothetical protein
VRSGFETAQRRNLPKKNAAVTPAGLVHHVGMEDGNRRPSRGLEQSLAITSGLFDARIKRRALLEVGANEIDDEQCRAHTR